MAVCRSVHSVCRARSLHVVVATTASFRSMMSISSRAHQCKKALCRVRSITNHKWTLIILVRLISVKLKKSIFINWTVPVGQYTIAAIPIESNISAMTDNVGRFYEFYAIASQKNRHTHFFNIIILIQLKRIRAPHTHNLCAVSFLVRLKPLVTLDTAFDCLKWLRFGWIEFQCGITANGSMVSRWNRFNYGKLVNTFRKFEQNKQCINHRGAVSDSKRNTHEHNTNKWKENQIHREFHEQCFRFALLLLCSLDVCFFSFRTINFRSRVERASYFTQVTFTLF